MAKRAQELTMEDEKEGFLGFLADIFFLPVQGLGRWISNKWKRYNALAALFNALIDMPFSVFVEFLEKWRYFIKDRKEEIGRGVAARKQDAEQKAAQQALNNLKRIGFSKPVPELYQKYCK